MRSSQKESPPSQEKKTAAGRSTGRMGGDQSKPKGPTTPQRPTSSRAAKETSKSSSSDSNNNGSSKESKPEIKGDKSPVSQPKSEPKVPTEGDLTRYEGYVGKEWTGVCKWFNVAKGK